MKNSFFAAVSRMKYIERWALMRNSRTENLSEHSMEVSVIAHALCVIGNVRYGKKLDANKAALIGLYHDASEIVTGDMPTPVKYYSSEIRDAYKQVESIAVYRLLNKLPEDLQPVYADIFKESGEPDDNYMRNLVKAADKLSALIKCTEEKNMGNIEFRTAEKTTQKVVDEMAEKYPEVKDFMENFLPSYGQTLDELM